MFNVGDRVQVSIFSGGWRVPAVIEDANAAKIDDEIAATYLCRVTAPAFELPPLLAAHLDSEGRAWFNDFEVS